MKTVAFDISIQIERAGSTKMVARSRGRAVEITAYHTLEEQYVNVSFGSWLQYNAVRVAHKFTNDLKMMSIGDYYQVRGTIESMLKMLHDYSVMRACSADVTVYLLEDYVIEDDN